MSALTCAASALTYAVSAMVCYFKCYPPVNVCCATLCRALLLYCFLCPQLPVQHLHTALNLQNWHALSVFCCAVLCAMCSLELSLFCSVPCAPKCQTLVSRFPNCPFFADPLQRAILFDYVPKTQRAKWAAVESVTRRVYGMLLMMGGLPCWTKGLRMKIVEMGSRTVLHGI